uniref:Uncharacterized protein n=1 Tax=Romanomermis culicivorax TaxID=13658 RepID=A0A915L0A4_ROMCU
MSSTCAKWSTSIRLLFRRCSGLLSFADSFLENGRLIEMNFEKFFNYSWINVFPLINLLQSPCSQSLQELNCVKVEFFDFHGLSPIQSVFQLPNLRIVELGQESCWPQWSPSLGDDMLIKCVDLEVLILVDASFLTRNLLQAICDYCPNITSLCMSGFRVTIDYRMIESLSKLTDLNVSDSDVTDEIVDNFARKLKNLTHFNIRGCKLLTNESLKSLAIYGQKLECLYLRRRSRKIDENGIQAVLDGCPNLKKLETTFNLAQKLRLPDRPDFEILNVTSE